MFGGGFSVLEPRLNQSNCRNFNHYLQSPKARLAKIKPHTAPPMKVLQGTELMEFIDAGLA